MGSAVYPGAGDRTQTWRTPGAEVAGHHFCHGQTPGPAHPLPCANRHSWPETQVCRGRTKTQKSRRSIEIAPFALAVLREHRMRQLEAKLKAGQLWEEHDYLFCTSLGRHLNPNHVVDELKKLLKRAGLPNIRFHDLRHSVASLMFAMEIHPKIVQELLGHSTISITMDIYSHMLPGMQQEAVKKLDQALKQTYDTLREQSQ